MNACRSRSGKHSGRGIQGHDPDAQCGGRRARLTCETSSKNGETYPGAHYPCSDDTTLPLITNFKDPTGLIMNMYMVSIHVMGGYVRLTNRNADTTANIGSSDITEHSSLYIGLLDGHLLNDTNVNIKSRQTMAVGIEWIGSDVAYYTRMVRGILIVE